MKQHLSFHRITDPARGALRERFAELAAKLERHLKHFQPDLPHLEGRIEQNPNHRLFRVDLRLKLPSGVLASHEEGHELQPLLKEAFEELERRLRKHLDRLRRMHLWKRTPRRRQLRELLKERPPAAEGRASAEVGRRRRFFEHVEPHLDTLHAFLRRELTYLESTGALNPGEVTTQELLDAVLLRGYERFEAAPAQVPTSRWLLSLAVETTAEELAPLRDEIPDAASLERAPPRTADVDSTGEERLDYWIPEERLALEDLLPARESGTPEEAESREQLQRALQRGIAELPQAWRQAVSLTGMEELSEAEAAEVLGVATEELQTMLRHARAFLAARLRDAGFSEADLGPGATEQLAVTAPAAVPAEMRRELRQLLEAEPAPGERKASEGPNPT